MFAAVSAGEIGLIICSIPSFILYILVLIVLVKKRRIHPLDNHFFRLCISLGVADLALGVHTFVQIYFRYWHWIDYYPLFTHAIMGRFFRLLNAVPGTFLFHVQYQGALALAINRYFGIAYFNKGLWTDDVNFRSLIIQWLFPAVISIPVLTQNPTIYLQNSTIGRPYAVIGMPREFAKVYYVGFCGSVAFAVIFSKAILCFLTYRSVRKMAKDHQLPENIKAEVRLATIGFVLFLIMAGQQTTFVLGIISRNVSYRRLGFHISIIFSFINPFLLLACSKPFRKHFCAFFKTPNRVKPSAKKREHAGPNAAKPGNAAAKQQHAHE